MSDQSGGPGPADDRPGPYQGAFGSSGRQPPPYGGQPGPYGGSFGQQPNPYSYGPDPVAPPKQVTIASAISFGLGGLCVLLGAFSVTSAGEQIAETLTGSKDSQALVVAVVLLCAVAYILPAVFLRKRRRWARIMLMVVAVFGITGGVTALPGSLLGLALHLTLLVLMLQQPTKLWFLGPRR
ncbi:hypothetical protein GCM10009789_04240 [Kribbella sancticallisti]|uniref:Uncharacterized protein n=1 Tax=Kribbella sancticallisti TaxID=460087 RepID=A0ABN2C795_9ACTN